MTPTYFVATGLEVDVTQLGTTGAPWLVGLLLLATATKVGGVLWAGRLAHMSGRDSIALGLLLNTRGLTEIIVLDVGRSAGIIDGQLFTILVLVAIGTTAITMPLVPRVLQQKPLRSAPRGEISPPAYPL